MTESPTTPAPGPRGLERVREELPPGMVPGGFARDFCRIFGTELRDRFGRGPACADSSRSGSE